MKEEQIKEAFGKVKQDMQHFNREIEKIKLGILSLKSEIKIISQALSDLNKQKSEEKEKLEEKAENNQKKTPTQTPTHPEKTPTNQQITPTHKEIPTDKVLSQVLKGQNVLISTGNGGVPTDRQTNRQTDRHIIQHINLQETEKKPEISAHLLQKSSKIDHLQKASEILGNLDALKKEIRRKFKALTNQEMSVFSLLYQLEQEGNEVDYPLLSSKLNLSESSIRDYIGKIQKKGIPITKEKLNNKKIILHISPDLKKIASLDTILKLREL